MCSPYSRLLTTRQPGKATYPAPALHLPFVSMEENRVVPRAFEEEVGRGRTVAKSLHYCSLAATWPLCVGRVKRVVAMSDLHGATTVAVNRLIRRGIIDDETIVLCTGDMTGNGRMGADGDPYDDYVRLRDAARALYLVQGNHDRESQAVLTMCNSDGRPCCVHRRAVSTPLGRITGVSGIMAGDGSQGTGGQADPTLHKYPADIYMRWVRQAAALRPDVLLTHMPLSATAQQEAIRSVPIHLFGHAHVDEGYASVPEWGQGLRLNMDSRIFVFE